MRLRTLHIIWNKKTQLDERRGWGRGFAYGAQCFFSSYDEQNKFVLEILSRDIADRRSILLAGELKMLSILRSAYVCIVYIYLYIYTYIQWIYTCSKNKYLWMNWRVALLVIVSWIQQEHLIAHGYMLYCIYFIYNIYALLYSDCLLTMPSIVVTIHHLALDEFIVLFLWFFRFYLD